MKPLPGLIRPNPINRTQSLQPLQRTRYMLPALLIDFDCTADSGARADRAFGACCGF